jgi:hypothetical protein
MLSTAARHRYAAKMIWCKAGYDLQPAVSQLRSQWIHGIDDAARGAYTFSAGNLFGI